MDFQIDKGLNLSINGQKVTAKAGSLTEDPFNASVSKVLSQPEDLEKFEDRISIPTKPSEGQASVISSIQQAVGTADSALKTISTIRERQLELSEITQNTPYGGQTAAISSELVKLEKEIGRIPISATFNGNAVIGSFSIFSYDNSAEDIHSVVSLPDTSAVYEGLPYEVFPNQETSTQNTRFLEGHLVTLSSLTSAVSSAVRKSTQLESAEPERTPLEEALVNEHLSQTPANFSEAKKLAGKIAQQLSSPYTKESQALSLVSSINDELDEEKVRGLLAEA